LSPHVRIAATDQNDEWLGIPRFPLYISPWHGRTNSLPAGAIVRWTVWFDRLRFIKPLQAGSTVKLRFSLPTQIEEPGKLPWTEYNEPIVIKLEDAHPSPLCPGDVPRQWARFMDLVYCEQDFLSGHFGVHIDGRGRVTMVNGLRQENPPLQMLAGRSEVVLGREHLDKLANRLQELKIWELAKLKPEIAYPDEPEIRLSLTSAGASLVGDFPMHVVRKQPALLALRKEMHTLITAAVAAAKEDQKGWSEPTEGVQCRLRPDKTEWQLGETPMFKADVRNHGVRHLFVCQAQQLCELQFDGQLYYWAGEIALPSSAFEPGRRYNDIRIALEKSWHSRKGWKPLTLTAGKHTIRVVFVARPIGRNAGPPVRAASNAVEINILPVR